MSNIIIQVENISKQYRLGQVGRSTMHDDITRWMHRVMGKPDPFLKIGEDNDRSKKSASDYVWALRDINFEVRQGEVLGIIGRNGAGKSTLLKILSKVTTPTTGQIKVKGRIASLLEVGTGFHPELSGRDNIFLNGAILGMTRKEIQQKFDAIVDFAGVERYIDTPVKRYSSGMYVRLAFAVAAHLEPDILIVDEVLAVGDAEFQKKCLGKMKEVSERDGRTVLFVSHNMPAVLNLCTHAMVLQFGKTLYNGATEPAIQHYLHNKQAAIQLPVASRTDRKGSGQLTCTGVQIADEMGKALAIVKSGDEVNIQVEYTMHLPVVRQLLCRLQFVNANDDLMFICNNEHAAGLFDISAKDGVLSCCIERLPLFGGDYTINVQLFSRETGLLDEVEAATTLTVVDGDFFGTGKIPVIRKGLLVPHNWTTQHG
jgi:lipopolysaccharide transport system ATP-binding protein